MGRSAAIRAMDESWQWAAQNPTHVDMPSSTSPHQRGMLLGWRVVGFLSRIELTTSFFADLG